MQRKLYPTDVTDKQWAILSPLIPVAKTGGRPRRVNLRQVVQAGALGYLLKDATAEELLDAIRVVHQGKKEVHSAPGSNEISRADKQL